MLWVAVIMVARNEERLKREADKLKNASIIGCDLSIEGELDKLVETIKQNHPKLNMAFLNAGMATNYELFSRNDSSKPLPCTEPSPSMYASGASMS